jgi:hypothetical protein
LTWKKIIKEIINVQFFYIIIDVQIDFSSLLNLIYYNVERNLSGISFFILRSSWDIHVLGISTIFFHATESGQSRLKWLCMVFVKSKFHPLMIWDELMAAKESDCMMGWWSILWDNRNSISHQLPPFVFARLLRLGKEQFIQKWTIKFYVHDLQHDPGQSYSIKDPRGGYLDFKWDVATISYQGSKNLLTLKTWWIQ